MSAHEQDNLSKLFEKNKQWAASMTANDHCYFKDLAEEQQPNYLWIGCSDSRVPPETIMQLGPGDIFVHRNIANQLPHQDLSSLSVLQFAVDVLLVKHVIVCGHYGCGGVMASMSHAQHGIVDNWLGSIKDVYAEHENELCKLSENERVKRLVELNVIRQVNNVASTSVVQNAWDRGCRLEVHAWVFDLETGLLTDLKRTIRNRDDLYNNVYVYHHHH